jgi:serine/threonine protein kinase
MTVIAGSRLGRYEVRTHIGAGGMGEVYLAWDRELERQVALKVLPPDVVGDTTRLERFIREAKAASALNHPNILTVYDVGQSEAARFIVTEYVDGETIRALIARGALDVPKALDITMQVTSALAEAHRAGIVHRDIKPSRVKNVSVAPPAIR